MPEIAGEVEEDPEQSTRGEVWPSTPEQEAGQAAPQPHESGRGANPSGDGDEHGAAGVRGGGATHRNPPVSICIPVSVSVSCASSRDR